MKCTKCGATGYGLHHSASCDYLNIDVYKKCDQFKSDLAAKDKALKYALRFLDPRSCDREYIRQALTKGGE